MQDWNAGSSPRLRGTRLDDRPVELPHRFIPASAGNSGCRRRTRHSAPVHPRVCGELRGIIAASMPTNGSSPRLRGTLRLRAQRTQKLRFIPASAGNSPPLQACRPSPTVHPRVCGELKGIAPMPKPTSGSSPRLRGTLEFPRAGPVESQVHPRVCGELMGMVDALSTTAGSSPRLRGTQRVHPMVYVN